MSISRQDCISALRSTGLSEVDAEQTVKGMLERKKYLEADGKIADIEKGLAESIISDHNAARLENALKRRQTAITIKRRVEVENFLSQAKSEGFSFVDGMQALLVGTQNALPERVNL